MSINIQLVKYILAGAILLVVLVIAAIAGVLILRGVPTTAPQLVSLLGVLATLVALLSGLLGLGAVANQTQANAQQLNGHMEAHTDALPDQIRQAIKEELDRRMATSTIAPPSPPATSGGATA